LFLVICARETWGLSLDFLVNARRDLVSQSPHAPFRHVAFSEQVRRTRLVHPVTGDVSGLFRHGFCFGESLLCLLLLFEGPAGSLLLPLPHPQLFGYSRVELIAVGVEELPANAFRHRRLVDPVAARENCASLLIKVCDITDESTAR